MHAWKCEPACRASLSSSEGYTDWDNYFKFQGAPYQSYA